MGGAMDRRVAGAWCMYDWANSAFATVVLSAVFPPFYRSIALRGGLSGAQATAAWGYTASAAMLVAALAAPILGAISDSSGRRKVWLAAFTALGVLGSLGCGLLGRDAWLTASLVFAAANVGFAASEALYESFLPNIAGGGGDMDRLSSRGYATGYLGGGILLVLNALWLWRPRAFGFSGAEAAVRASFVGAGLWWGLFSLPLFARVPEFPAAGGGGSRLSVAAAFRRVAATIRDVRRHRQAALFLAAFWTYNDGIGTIIKMATAYGAEIGIRLSHMVAALIVTQFVGIPFAFLFGRLAGRVGAKRALYVALAGYALISAMGYFMRTAVHFYLLAAMVGMVQGGSQALSRSLFGSMVPRHRTAEFFGFFSTSAKFAGIAGPLLFGVLAQATGRSRVSIVALILFFAGGALLLRRVNVPEGVRAAREAEAGPERPA
jgi:UMF1 family MFS transporter